ncbi:MAG: hypothetical protein CEE38_18795 [Planctomycetes bacterium B3_Pla]|nr:MAG: hypothetical protein CEE38_18795 [Planctomycetes bacterium B3_Pla]
MDEEACRACWQNCGSEVDAEMLEIDRAEDALGPLDEHSAAIRQLITRFEVCYHEADKEAERIVEAIGAGRCGQESGERPPQRKKELENCRRILSSWCENPAGEAAGLDVGGIPADELLGFIGKASALKIWQVQRIIDKVTEALDPSRPYHWMALDMGDYGEPGARPAGEHYKDNAAFLEQTRAAIIHDTVDGRKAEISLAMAIDMFMPCHWDLPGALVIILKAIGGDLHPARPLACCSRNVSLSPLCERTKTISNTLRAFWKGEKLNENTDADILALLGEATPAKCWLAASLDKTIRLQLDTASDFWLKSG